MSLGVLILLAIGIPFMGAPLIWLTGGSPNQRETVTLVTAISLFVAVLSILPVLNSGANLELVLFDILPALPLAFKVEPLGMMFACVASGLWIINSIYSIGYMRGNKEAHQTRFYVCFSIAIGGAIGIAFAGNLLTLFIFYEVLTLCTYPLVTHHEDDEARRGGRVYLGVLMATSLALFLLAILITWFEAGTLEFTQGGILQGQVSDQLGSILLLLYMFGIGKAALMPFHRWLPAAMVAPTPVSALLHAVAVVKAGVFTIVKVAVYIFGIDYLRTLTAADVVLYAASFTIVAASIVALRQDNLKRRLAYSTVSQLSYVILAMFILSPLSVMGAVLHIAAHAFGKITLFFAAGSIYTAAHKTEISQMDGIGRRMPWTMTAFAIGALSMIGIPPAAGFLSKWYMLLGAFDSAQWFAVVIIIVSTLLNAAYFLPIVYAAFLKAPDPDGHDEHGEAPWPIVIAVAATAALTLLLFFLPDTALNLAGGVVGR